MEQEGNNAASERNSQRDKGASTWNGGGSAGHMLGNDQAKGKTLRLGQREVY